MYTKTEHNNFVGGFIYYSLRNVNKLFLKLLLFCLKIHLVLELPTEYNVYFGMNSKATHVSLVMYISLFSNYDNYLYVRQRLVQWISASHLHFRPLVHPGVFSNSLFLS